MKKPVKDMKIVFQDEHELFTKLISAIPDTVILTDVQGKIIFVNDVGIKLLRSTSAKKIIGKDALSFIVPQQQKKAKKNLARLLKHLPRLLTGNINPNEYTVIAEDGSHIPVEIHGSVLKNTDGSPLARVHVCRDITERKRAEEAIIKSEQKYRAILDKAPDAVLLRNIHGNVIDANEQATKLFGYRKQELIGQHLSDIYPPEELEKAKKAFDIVKQRGKARLDDAYILRKDGQKINVDASGSCFTVSSEALYQIIFRDVTEQRKRQEQLKNAKVELEARIVERTMELMEANTALKVLMSHREKEKYEDEEKLLTNLQGQVLPYIHNLMKGQLNSKQKDELKMLEKNLQGVMSEFLTRFQSNVSKFTPKEIQVASLIKEGMGTKEIARLMNVSTKTVDIFRYNIRKKLGLNNRSTNLRSHLLSM
ncbi:MAG: PAS domain S-box protein [Syntrophales bacterium]